MYIYICFTKRFVQNIFRISLPLHIEIMDGTRLGLKLMWCHQFRNCKILGVKDLIVISISKISNYLENPKIVTPP